MTDRAAYVRGLRTLADRLDANPDCPLPYTGNREHGPLLWILSSREDVAAVTRLLGNVAKGQDAGGSLMLTSRLDGLGIEVLTFGDVCERVEVGRTTETREVEVCSVCEAELIYDADARARRCPEDGEGFVAHDRFPDPQTKAVESWVPVYEVRCPESILAPVTEDAEATA